MEFPSFDRRTIVGLSIGALIPAFALTHTVVARYRVSRHRLAEEWSARGERDLSDAPEAAVVDFQTALSFSPDRNDDRLRLAEALMQAHHPAEARAQLLTLWAEQPGNGRINLALARLAAEDGDVGHAVRYYHAAVDGSWDSGAQAARREARIESAKLLLAHGQLVRAQSELIGIISDLPSDSGTITSVAALLVSAGADSRARALLDRALALDPGNRDAARLAGQIAFRSGDYHGAREYFRVAEVSDAESKEMLAISEDVIALDPFARGLVHTDRVSRARECLEIAAERLHRCQLPATAPPGAPLRYPDQAARLEAARKLSVRQLTRDAEALDDVMTLAFDIEKIQDAQCGPMDARDRALLILAQRGVR
ncbi:MAG TPA: tetratricopeptide repeat protein [Vicinamibacterales bacterium]|nr:tetratricopeptide repeat protein [Vicinamibacterales bacterium]